MTKNKLRNLLTLFGLAIAVLLTLMNNQQSAQGGSDLRTLYEEGRSGEMIEVAGSVVRLLSDDLEGSRHQRFILDAGDGMTVLIAHNIDLAERVPLSAGQSVSVLGQYEWNDRGGVLHWTHHDPQGRRDGGWIKADGRTYR